MRIPAFRSPRPAALIASGLALVVLGALGTATAPPATGSAPPAPHPTAAAVGTGDDLPECQGEVEFADVCAMVAARPAYAYTDVDGAVHHVPDGRTLLAGVDLPRGSEAFGVRLFELDAEYVERALHNED
ncbi:hypothetical protein AB0G49_14230 [Streptomyces longwoodensis]|uniref:hypothetical protein n=1 Tax=Streptomyces longwoodensis TaxID=68231 RepID=UPI0033DB13C9